MKPAAPLIVLLCLASPLAVSRAYGAQLNYTLYVVGLPVADASLTVDLGETGYRVSLQFHTTGLANVIDGGRLQESTTGSFESDRPAPQYYTSVGFLHGQDRVVDMTWHDGTPVTTSITPPNATEREDVPVALRAGTVDQPSVIVLLLHVLAQTGRCEGAARSYDGRDLQSFQSWTVGQDTIAPSDRSSFSGPALRCAYSSRTLAGFRFDANDYDRRAHRGEIWLAQLVAGLPPLPVRAAAETRWLGDAMIYLTSVYP